MTEFTNFFGIDISKNNFDVVRDDGKHLQFKNNSTGFE
jgi:hypothetical protein